MEVVPQKNSAVEELRIKWGGLSPDAQKLAMILAQSGGSESGEQLEIYAEDEKFSFDLEEGLRLLKEQNLMEEITSIQEMRERLARFPEPRALLLMTSDQIPAGKIVESFPQTQEERDYLWTKRCIGEYEVGIKREPEKFKSWDEPRFRLNSGFQQFLEEMFNG